MKLEKFIQSISRISVICGFEVSEKQTGALFSFFSKQNIADEEFSDVCDSVLAHERFYGKFPEPAVFLAHLEFIRRRNSEVTQPKINGEIPELVRKATLESDVKMDFIVLHKNKTIRKFAEVQGESDEDYIRHLVKKYPELDESEIRKICLEKH